MKIGFDNQKYLTMQSEHIRERISKFGDKLYLEFGGKLFDIVSVIFLYYLLADKFGCEKVYGEIDLLPSKCRM